jgi:hypothetical protein
MSAPRLNAVSASHFATGRLYEVQADLNTPFAMIWAKSFCCAQIPGFGEANGL